MAAFSGRITSLSYAGFQVTRLRGLSTIRYSPPRRYGWESVKPQHNGTGRSPDSWQPLLDSTSVRSSSRARLHYPDYAVRSFLMLLVTNACCRFAVKLPVLSGRGVVATFTSTPHCYQGQDLVRACCTYVWSKVPQTKRQQLLLVPSNSKTALSVSETLTRLCCLLRLAQQYDDA